MRLKEETSQPQQGVPSDTAVDDDLYPALAIIRNIPITPMLVYGPSCNAGLYMINGILGPGGWKGQVLDHTGIDAYVYTGR